MSSNAPSQGAAPAPAAPPPPPATVSCTIDGKPYTFPRGTLIVNAVHQVDRPIPYYCYHPKLAPVGACRVCMVSVLGAPLTRPGMGAIVTTACTTPVFEGLQIETMSDPAKLARKQVLEFLLINHPLDCPICDKGGECDLQDFTQAYGPGKSGFAENKILRKKADDLGPFLVLDQERCIMCQRCVRYENEVLGEQNIVLKERGDHTVIETGHGEPYGGYFSGNNTELCPVGALTSRTYRFKARPWDVRPVATHCAGCSVACEATVNVRNGSIVRLLMGNDWLCDRGRYGFAHTTDGARLTTPLVKRDGKLVPASWDEAVAAAAAGLAKGAGVLGGGRLTNAEAVSLAALARTGLKTTHVDWRVGYQGFAAPEAVGLRGAPVAALDSADLVLLLDTALLQEAPVLEIRLRRAAGKKTKVVDLGPVRNFPLGPAERIACAPDEIPARLAALAERFAAAKSPVVIWNGRGGADVLEAVRTLAAPVLTPGEFPNGRGAEAAGLGAASAGEILAEAAAGRLAALYLVGSNPLATYPDGRLAAAALDAVGFVVVQDLFLTEAAQRADVVLPALGSLEKTGEITDLTGTVQPIRAAVAGPAGARADQAIFGLLAAALGADLTSRAEAPPVVVPTQPPAAAGSGLRLLLRPRLYAGSGLAAHDANLAKVREAPVVRLHPEDGAAARLPDGAAVHVGGAGAVWRASVVWDRGVAPGFVIGPAHVLGPNSLGDGPAPAVSLALAEPATGVTA